jgi:Animal haem peroxidase
LDDNCPQLADGRNSENLILRQVHVLFLRLHNCAVKELKQTRPGLSNEEVFKRAQQRVRWQFQWLVRHDYLSRICDKGVYDDVVERGHRRIDWSKGFSIPIEFSLAAFRFGHSMVRPDYKLNDGVERMSLDKLFAEHKSGAIDPQLAVDWEEFLTTNHKPEFSMRIDRAIVKPLYSLPDASIHLFVNSSGPHGPNALPVRTLFRGSAARLCTGQQAREQLTPESILLEPRIVKDHPYHPWEDLKEVGLAEQTPLWYYVLLEAELNENGRRLGPLGSRIVLEVIEASLLADPDSFVSIHGSSWEPPPWITSSGESVPVRTLFDLADVVGLKSVHRQH